MVKIGFIVEGACEKVLIESKVFQEWAERHGIVVTHPVVNARGGGNLLPQNIEPSIAQIQLSQPDHIVILTDLEREASEELVRQRIGEKHTDLIFIAVKALEAWYLADSEAMKKWLGLGGFYEGKPQETPDLPWDRLKEIAKEKNKRGPGPNKIKFSINMVERFGFDLARAAQHPHCSSAKTFHDGLLALVNPA